MTSSCRANKRDVSTHWARSRHIDAELRNSGGSVVSCIMHSIERDVTTKPIDNEMPTHLSGQKQKGMGRRMHNQMMHMALRNDEEK